VDVAFTVLSFVVSGTFGVILLSLGIIHTLHFTYIHNIAQTDSHASSGKDRIPYSFLTERAHVPKTVHGLAQLLSPPGLSAFLLL